MFAHFVRRSLGSYNRDDENVFVLRTTNRDGKSSFGYPAMGGFVGRRYYNFKEGDEKQLLVVGDSLTLGRKNLPKSEYYHSGFGTCSDEKAKQTKT